MKVSIVSQKLIKPCTPTPQNLNKHKLCFIDENMPPMNLGIVLLFSPISNDDNLKQKRIQHLEESLSEILSKFYPLAGRYTKNDGFVDCSDQGAEFVVAEADDVDFIDLVSKMEREHINDLLPSKFHKIDESPTDPLLAIKVTELKLCGGLAISVSISHRIFDASSVGAFIAAWSNATNNCHNNNPGGKIEICPSFESQSLLWTGEGRNAVMDYHDDADSLPTTYTDVVPLTFKRFCFNRDAITRLRSKLTSTNYYSRVRVVCAIIAKALMGLDRAKHGGKSRACLIVQPVNMRGRTIPPLPKHSCGNFSILSSTRCMFETEIDGSTINGIEQLVVNAIGDGLEKTIGECAEIFSPGGTRDAYSIMMDPVMNWIEIESTGEVNVIPFSDWSKFGFYEADFGWGKPIGAGMGTPAAVENAVTLMDSKEEGGIEAWVTLNRDDMAFFEQDHDIKSFTN